MIPIEIIFFLSEEYSLVHEYWQQIFLGFVVWKYLWFTLVFGKLKIIFTQYPEAMISCFLVFSILIKLEVSLTVASLMVRMYPLLLVSFKILSLCFIFSTLAIMCLSFIYISPVDFLFLNL